MKRLLLAGGLLVLGACHDDSARIEVGVGVSVAAPLPTEVLLQAKNCDRFDYALWLEWQDATGAWMQTYLFSLYADSAVGPTMDYLVFLANPDISYNVILADPDGTVYDSYPLWIPSGSSADISFHVVGGHLVRQF